jgi:hypothetical protein
MSESNEKTVDLIPAFDYGSINETHQSAAKEIAGWLASLGHQEIAEELLVRFKIVKIPTYDVSQSKFYQYAKKAGIYVAGQGTLIEGQGKDAMQFPLVAITGDIRELDKFIDLIKNDQ